MFYFFFYKLKYFKFFITYSILVNCFICYWNSLYGQLSFCLPLGIKLRFFNNYIFIIQENNKNKIICHYWLKKIKQFMFLFYSIILNNYFFLNNGVFNILFLKGVGYKVFIKNIHLIFFLGFSNIINIMIPKIIIINIKNDAKNILIFFYSFTKIFLEQYIYKLQLLKKRNKYKIMGLYTSSELEYLKIKYKIKFKK